MARTDEEGSVEGDVVDPRTSFGGLPFLVEAVRRENDIVRGRKNEAQLLAEAVKKT